MGKDEPRKGLSRRQFVKTLGSGALGGTLLVNVPNAFADPPDPSPDETESGEKGRGSQLLELTVNGRPERRWIDANTTLADFLRDHLHLTGTKITCNRGQCGACTVLLDDRAVYSCQMLALDASGHTVTTVEGLLTGEKLHPLQQAFVDKDGLQCGFCTPGQIMAAQALLLKHPHPTREQVLTGMSGNLCRCSAYPKIVDSVLAVGK